MFISAIYLCSLLLLFVLTVAKLALTQETLDEPFLIQKVLLLAGLNKSTLRHYFNLQSLDWPN